MSSGVGCRRGSDPAQLWLWCRPAATVPIRPLAWEPPYAKGAALEKVKRQKPKKKKKKITLHENDEQSLFNDRLGPISEFLIKKMFGGAGNLHFLIPFARIFFFFLNFQACTCGIWKFLGQGSNQSCSPGLYHSQGNARSKPYLQPTPQVMPDPLAH